MHYILWYPADALILTHSVNVTFGPKSGFKNKCQAWTGFGLVISGSSRVRASKWDPFTTLVHGYTKFGDHCLRVHLSSTNCRLTVLSVMCNVRKMGRILGPASNFLWINNLWRFKLLWFHERSHKLTNKNFHFEDFLAPLIWRLPQTPGLDPPLIIWWVLQHNVLAVLYGFRISTWTLQSAI